MFPENGSDIDSALQEQVITNMYKRRTSIPFFAGNDNIQWASGEEAQFDQLGQTNSICGYIFQYGGDGQPMEVVEHILHFVSMVGLHYTFYDDGGVNDSSVQYNEMQIAIRKNYYKEDYGS